MLDLHDTYLMSISNEADSQKRNTIMASDHYNPFFAAFMAYLLIYLFWLACLA
jgi:hypothetical protein